MQIRVSLKTLKAHAPNLIPDWMKNREITDTNNSYTDVTDAHLLAPALIEKFRKATLAEQAATPPLVGCTSAMETIRKVVRFQAQPDVKTRFVTDLDDMLPSLKELIQETSPERHWVYREMVDGHIVPAYVSNIIKVPYRRDEPAYIKMELVWMEGGKRRKMSVHFHRSDVSSLLNDDAAIGTGNTADAEDIFSQDLDDDDDAKKPTKARKVKRSLIQILTGKGLLVETPELLAEYKATMPRYFKFTGKQGICMKGSGDGIYMKREKSYGADNFTVTCMSMERDGVSGELVLDDTNAEEVKFRSGIDFWHFDHNDNDFDISKFWTTGKVTLPFQPYLLCFDLTKHQHVWVHADALEAKAFEKDILKKLVLPKREKAFLTLLINSAGVKMNDIIKGKAGGIFILSEGPPGTGKTLTAEVYAEQMGKPLYSVQCSQLGVNPEEIEDRLKRVLDRAQRWGAILLLDEADVYIRTRGEDVDHNAIVGVMLRVIEYYNGLLFMTTNLHSIDDAIKSRATAHVLYKCPGAELLRQIWSVLSRQLEVNLKEADINELVESWPQIVGRDVKNLLKLTKLAIITGGEQPTAETVKMVSEFQDVGRKVA